MLLITLACAGGSFALMQAFLMPALPVLQRDLGATTAWVAWTVSIYLLSGAVATPLISRLGDQHGRVRMMMVTLGLLRRLDRRILAWDMGSLIVAGPCRGSAARSFRSASRSSATSSRAQGWAWRWGSISAVLGVGGGLGMALSGPMVDHGSWRRLFAVGALVGGLALRSCGACALPGPRAATLDLPGAALLSAGLICLLVAVTQGEAWGWASAGVLGLGAAGLAFMAVWVVVARTAAHGDMRMMARRPVLFTNLAALFAASPCTRASACCRSSSRSRGGCPRRWPAGRLRLRRHRHRLGPAPAAGRAGHAAGRAHGAACWAGASARATRWRSAWP